MTYEPKTYITWNALGALIPAEIPVGMNDFDWTSLEKRTWWHVTEGKRNPTFRSPWTHLGSIQAATDRGVTLARMPHAGPQTMYKVKISVALTFPSFVFVEGSGSGRGPDKLASEAVDFNAAYYVNIHEDGGSVSLMLDPAVLGRLEDPNNPNVFGHQSWP